MQSEVCAYCPEKPAVFGPDDVPPPAGSPELVLRLVEEPDEQASHRGQATERVAPEDVGRERQGLWISKAA